MHDKANEDVFGFEHALLSNVYFLPHYEENSEKFSHYGTFILPIGIGDIIYLFQSPE